MGTSPAGGAIRVRFMKPWAVAKGRDLGALKLAYQKGNMAWRGVTGRCNVIYLVGKEPELVWVYFGARLGACLLEVSPVDERVASLCLQVQGWALTVVCAYAPNKQFRVSGLLGVFRGGAGRYSSWGLFYSVGTLQFSQQYEMKGCGWEEEHLQS